MITDLGIIFTAFGVIALLAVPLASASDIFAHVVYGADQSAPETSGTVSLRWLPWMSRRSRLLTSWARPLVARPP